MRYIFVTAERLTAGVRELYAPTVDHTDFQLHPPLIVDGGWTGLMEAFVDKTKNWGLPDVSALERFFTVSSQKHYRIGWGVYSSLKNITTPNGHKFGTQFSQISNHGDLRVIYWWG